MRNIYFLVLLSLLTFGLTGCAVPVQAPIEFSNNFWQEKDKTIGVIMSDIPKTETTIVGAGCLLCYATAAAANFSLDKHLKTIPIDDVSILKQKVFNTLVERGMNVSMLEQNIVVKKLKKFKSKEPNVAVKDFSTFQNKELDYLLVIDVKQVGAYRSYSGYIPTTDPLSVFSGLAYIIDLKTNKYAWYYPFDHKMPADLEWDEPPAFPGLTNSLYEVITLGNESVIEALKTRKVNNTPTNASALVGISE